MNSDQISNPLDETKLFALFQVGKSLWETSEGADQPSKWSAHKIVPDSKDTFELFIHHTEILEELYVLREEARQYCEQLSEDLRWKSNKKW